jgi:leucyl-tRNA synthetase
MMILVNELTWVEKISKNTFQTLIVLLAPFAPHLAEEFREKLWNQFSIFDGKNRPELDEKYLVQDMITMAVQVNGKVRWTIEISKDATQNDVMEVIKKDEKISRNLVWDIKKVIYIPWKICNIVI